MKKTILLLVVIVVSFALQNCGSVKTLDAWSADEEVVEKFKTKNVLVYGRTADNTARIAFEEALAKELNARGIKATESFKKFPKIYANKEISEDRVALVQSVLDSEGYNGIVVVAVKNKEQETTTSSSGVYVGGGYGYGGYPGYYGGFYNYYRTPYAYGPYYGGYGGYAPISSTTSTSTTYVLETVFYNLDEPEESQLVAVVTSSLTDPKESYKTADKYVKSMVKGFE